MAAAAEPLTPADAPAAAAAAPALPLPADAPAATARPLPADAAPVDAAPAGAEAKPADDLAAAPQVPRTATFTFKATFAAALPRLTLGDLAACTGDRVICGEAYGVELSASPEPGRTLALPVEKLRMLLTAEWPDAEIRVDAPKTVRVTALAGSLAEDSLLIALRGALADQSFAAGAFAVTVERATLSAPLRLRPGTFHIEFPDLTAEHLGNAEWLLKNLTGFQRLAGACIMDAEGVGATPFVVSAQLTLREKLPVPSRDLDKGEIIQEQDLTEAWVVVSHGGAKGYASAAALVGRRLRRAAPALQPVASGQVEIPKVVARGQVLKLLIHGAGLDVSSQVVAQSAAGIGQSLEVLYPATKKKLQVRVVDAQTVEYVH